MSSKLQSGSTQGTPASRGVVVGVSSQDDAGPPGRCPLGEVRPRSPSRTRQAVPSRVWIVFAHRESSLNSGGAFFQFYSPVLFFSLPHGFPGCSGPTARIGEIYVLNSMKANSIGHESDLLLASLLRKSISERIGFQFVDEIVDEIVDGLYFVDEIAHPALRAAKFA